MHSFKMIGREIVGGIYSNTNRTWKKLSQKSGKKLIKNNERITHQTTGTSSDYLKQV